MACNATYASSWTVLESRQYQDWEASYNKNNSTDEHFCSAETKASNGTIFRLNFYQSANGSFLEVFNSDWTLRKGGARFSLDFGNGTSILLRGKAWPDAYTHDLIDKKNIYLLLGALHKFSKFQVTNSNGARVASFSLKGSSGALAVLDDCAGGI